MHEYHSRRRRKNALFCGTVGSRVGRPIFLCFNCLCVYCNNNETNPPVSWFYFTGQTTAVLLAYSRKMRLLSRLRNGLPYSTTVEAIDSSSCEKLVHTLVLYTQLRAMCKQAPINATEPHSTTLTVGCPTEFPSPSTQRQTEAERADDWDT